MGVDYANGWDAVIASNFGDVGKLLNAAYQNNITPHQGSGTFQIPLGPVQVPATISASIGPWAMTGGTGQNVVLKVPLTGGNATIGDKGCALAGIVLDVTVLLRFVRSTLSGGGTEYQLTINIADPSAIVAFQIENPPADFTQQEVNALEITCRNMLQAAVSGSDIAIATLDLSAIASQFPWLMPTQGLSYAASSNSAAPGDGQIAILIASANPPPGPPPTLLNGTIPSGSDAALVISNALFCQRFLIPALASSLGASVSQFGLSGRNPATVVLSGQGHAGGGTITSAQAVANNNSISLHVEGNASPMDGVTVNFTIDATYGISLGGSADNPVLTFQETSHNENHSTDIAWWVYLVSGLSGGAIGILVATLIQQIVNSTAGSTLSGAMPASFVHAFAWPFAGTVTINQAAIPTPLVLGGAAQA
jgi:hypothetical protein